jgi:hypothetical protein
MRWLHASLLALDMYINGECIVSLHALIYFNSYYYYLHLRTAYGFCLNIFKFAKLLQ